MKVLVIALLLLLAVPVLAIESNMNVMVCGDLPSGQKKELADIYEKTFGVKPKTACIAEPSNLAKEIKVFGTEYVRGFDTIGTVFTQLIRENTTIDNANCLATVFRPNNSFFLLDSPMLFIGRGFYKRDYAVPPDLGIYPVGISCDIGVNFTSFQPAAMDVVIGTIVNGNFSDTLADDNSRLILSEAGAGATKRLDVRFNFTGVNASGFQSIQVIHDGQWTDNSENVVVQVFNFSSSTFVSLPNEIFQTSIDVTTTNSITANLTNFIANGTLRVRLLQDDLDNSASNLKIDLIGIRLAKPAQQPLEHLKGAGEIHIQQNQSNITLIVREILKSDIDEQLVSNHNVCISNTTLVHVLTKVRCIGSECITISENVTEVCNFGCDFQSQPNQCSPAPYQAGIMVVIGIIALILIVCAIWWVVVSKRW